MKNLELSRLHPLPERRGFSLALIKPRFVISGQTGHVFKLARGCRERAERLQATQASERNAHFIQLHL